METTNDVSINVEMDSGTVIPDVALSDLAKSTVNVFATRLPKNSAKMVSDVRTDVLRVSTTLAVNVVLLVLSGLLVNARYVLVTDYSCNV